MKERPILFTPENAQKCFEGKKTQTRRSIKPQPIEISWFEHQRGWCARVRHDTGSAKYPAYVMLPCPYGVVGDRLWVREAFTYWEDPGYDWKPTRKEPRFEYLSAKRQAEIIERSSTAGHDYLVYKGGGQKRSLGEWRYPHPVYEHCGGRFGKTVPGIHMPRWACRTVLEITAIRVERLQAISEEDAMAELGPVPHGETTGQYCALFQDLWESINGPGSWDANPWVWAMTFRKVA